MVEVFEIFGIIVMKRFVVFFIVVFFMVFVLVVNVVFVSDVEI